MQDRDGFTFPSRDLFAKIAALLASGTPPEKLGKRAQIANLKAHSYPPERLEKDAKGQTLSVEIVGTVTHIDRYGNIHTNIHQSKFEDLRSQFPNFTIDCSEPIKKISTAYLDVEEGEFLALFLSDGYLQIAQNQDSAARMLGLTKVNMPIIVRFEK